MAPGRCIPVCTVFFISVGMLGQLCAASDEHYITSEDITSHPTYSTSLEKFEHYEKQMYRIKERASFHSFVHIIPPVLELIRAVNVLEIGSYCGASLILELSVPTVQKLVSVDMIAHANRDTPKVISQNVEKYNTHGATFHQVTGDSRSQSVVSRVHDGDHRDCAPDFHLYQTVVRPGGVIMFDDYFDKRVKRAIKKSILRNETVQQCYHVLGTPKNKAKAATLGSSAEPPEESNEFIIQKNFDCVDL